MIWTALVDCWYLPPAKGSASVKVRRTLLVEAATVSEAQKASVAAADSTAACDRNWIGFECTTVGSVKFPLEVVTGALFTPSTFSNHKDTRPRRERRAK